MNATDKLPIVGLMLGDVTRIGAEIAAKMLATPDNPHGFTPRPANS
jgi:hypothetical protein